MIINNHGAIVSSGEVLSEIHRLRSVHRKWLHLDNDAKRFVLSEVAGECDEKTLLKAIRKVKRLRKNENQT